MIWLLIAVLNIVVGVGIFFGASRLLKRKRPERQEPGYLTYQVSEEDVKNGFIRPRL